MQQEHMSNHRGIQYLGQQVAHHHSRTMMYVSSGYIRNKETNKGFFHQHKYDPLFYFISNNA
jgi:hypothetical protein